MTEITKELKIGIYRDHSKDDPSISGDPINVDDVNVGALLNTLIEQPYFLAKTKADGKITLGFHRTHEWEILIDLALAGSGIFLTAAIQEVGKRFGAWLAGRVSELGTMKEPEVRALGLATVHVDPTDFEASNEAITELISNAADNNLQVELIVEPRQ